jgi:tripartite-type tricarboxylate transporter receptor subunit TctC
MKTTSRAETETRNKGAPMKNDRAHISLFAAALALGLGSAAGPASGEDYPSKTIRILVPQAPGGLVDILPRILGQKIAETTKQVVVVVNRLGGNGAVAGAEAARATPDGYTLMMSFHALNAMLPHMTSKLAFDPNKDLVPIVFILTVPNILVIHPSIPVSSVNELIAYAKANPGKLTFASQGVGSTGHVAGELFKQFTGVDIVHVPYRGAAPAAQALMGGQVTMMFDVVALAMEPVKTGKMRALGVAASSRVSVLSEIPTLAEAGLPMEISAWFGLLAPAGTPPSVIAWINREANQIFSLPEIRERYIAQGASLPLGPPEVFGLHIAAEYEKWGPVIRRANIRID